MPDRIKHIDLYRVPAWNADCQRADCDWSISTETKAEALHHARAHRKGHANADRWMRMGNRQGASK